MQWQCDPQKAQLEHKAQIFAEFHKWMYNYFRIVIRKRKQNVADAHPPVPELMPMAPLCNSQLLNLERGGGGL